MDRACTEKGTKPEKIFGAVMSSSSVFLLCLACYLCACSFSSSLSATVTTLAHTKKKKKITDDQGLHVNVNFSSPWYSWTINNMNKYEQGLRKGTTNDQTKSLLSAELQPLPSDWVSWDDESGGQVEAACSTFIIRHSLSCDPCEEPQARRAYHAIWWHQIPCNLATSELLESCKKTWWG